MQEKKVTCILCPMGCEIIVKGEGKNIVKVSENQCKRGKEYAINELLNPTRILTTTVKANNFYLPVVSVRSNKPIPKELLFECMDILKKIEIEVPLEIGQVVVENILDTGVDIVTTKI